MSQKDLKRRLSTLMKVADNQVCSDCTEKRPSWASIIVPPPGSPVGSQPIGAFCCLHCSGSHRRLGVHISFVRSITLDTWKENEVVAMENGGNKKVNLIFEHFEYLEPSVKPNKEAALTERERFIRDKYEHRKYFNPEAFESYSEGKDIIVQPIKEKSRAIDITLGAISIDDSAKKSVKNGSKKGMFSKIGGGGGSKQWRSKATEFGADDTRIYTDKFKLNNKSQTFFGRKNFTRLESDRTLNIDHMEGSNITPGEKSKNYDGIPDNIATKNSQCRKLYERKNGRSKSPIRRKNTLDILPTARRRVKGSDHTEALETLLPVSTKKNFSSRSESVDMIDPSKETSTRRGGRRKEKSSPPFISVQ